MQSALYLKELNIKNFRNISEAHLSFGQGLNLIVGDNGQGKTNCLEALALACSLRPMQSLQNAELIKFGEHRSELSAQYFDADVRIEISVQGKRASIDNKPLRSAAKLHARSPLVSFIPMELAMIGGSASLRRRALDLASCSFFFEHYEGLRAYEKVLLHRNRLLKSWPLDRELLNSFSELLIKEGSLIMHRRQKALRLLNLHFKESLSDILGPEFCGWLSYIGEEDTSSYTEEDFKALLKRCRDQSGHIEQIRKVTVFGPHLDDMAFFLNSVNAKSYASRGQMRALVLAFKLAHMTAVYSLRGNAPVVILDDIVSELDEKRKHNLLSVIANLGIQAFLSANDVTHFPGRLSEHQIFSVNEGKILAFLNS